MSSAPAAADDELRLVLQGEAFHLVVVHATGLAAEGIAYVVVEYAGGVDACAVRQVAALVEVEAHEGVARLEHGEQHGLVGLRAGVGLHVGELGAEETLHAVDGHHLAAAVVALAGETLGIFVGEVTAHGRHDLVGNEVLAGDELHAPELALVLLFDELKNLGVLLHNRLDYS